MFKNRSRLGATSRLVFCAVFAMSLAACGGEDAQPEAVASEDTPPPAEPSTPPPAPPVNNAPVLDGDPVLLARAGDPYTFSPAASDADNNPLTYTVTGLPEWATFNVANGTISGTPNDGHVGQTADIEITVSDGTDTDSIGPFQISIAARPVPNQPPPPPNNAPEINGTPAGLVVATHSYIFVPTATDRDGDRLTFAIANRPPWATFSTATGQLSGTPSRTQTGTFSNIRISVTDSRTVVALPPFDIRVQPLPNSPPVLSGAPATTATAGTTYSFTPSATDADGNTLRWSIQNQPTWLTFNNTTGRISGTPPSAGVFRDIRISANDGTVTVSLPAFTITVSAAPNRAPSISGSPATSAVAGSAYSFTPSASDPDAGTRLTFSIDNRPPWAQFDSATGRLSGTAVAGNYSGIVIRVTDSIATVALPTFSINVTSAPVSNRAPTITAIGMPATQVNAGSAYVFQVQGADQDGDALTYSIANRPSWATFNNTNGTLSGTPAAGDAGTTSGIVISVNDGRGGTASLNGFSITVNAAANGFADLQWTAPATNVDGTQLMDLAGFRVYYGTSSSNLDRVITVANADATTYRVTNLTSGTWHFSVRAYTTDGDESTNSNVASKTVP